MMKHIAKNVLAIQDWYKIQWFLPWAFVVVGLTTVGDDVILSDNLAAAASDFDDWDKKPIENGDGLPRGGLRIPESLESSSDDASDAPDDLCGDFRERVELRSFSISSFSRCKRWFSFCVCSESMCRMYVFSRNRLSWRSVICRTWSSSHRILERFC